MANLSSKIAPFPGCSDKRSVPAASSVPELGNDPTRELRSYIDGLQAEARVARANQEAAEEDRDRLAEEVRRMQREMDAAKEARNSARAIVVERDNLKASVEKNEALLAEIRRKTDGAERLRIQAESQRDQAMELVKVLRKEVEQHLSARDEAGRQRDAAMRQRAQSVRDYEETKTKLAEAQRQFSESQRALLEAEAGASKNREGEIQKQLLAIRQARDSAAKQAAEFKEKISELEDAIAELTYDREVSDKATKRAVIEADALRAQAEADAERAQMMETLQAELAEVNEELTSLRSQHATVQGAKDQLVAQLREFRETHEAMLISNMSQIEGTSKERDLLRTRLQEREQELQDVRNELAAAWSGAMQVTEPEIERLTKEVDSMRQRAAEMNGVVSQSEEMTRQREEMRLQVIELTAMLENARREIKEIGAQLAEARLQLKLAGKATMAPPVCKPFVPLPVEEYEEYAEGAAIECVAPSAPTQVDRIAAMRSAWERWNSQPLDQTAVWDMVREATAYSGSCKAGGHQILDRMSSQMASALERVVQNPDSATSRLRALIGKSIDLLADLESMAEVDEKVRLTGSRVYVVDDDPDLCTFTSELLGAAGFWVDHTQHSSAAIAHLAETSYDLILLDIRLPEVDGFELCGYIRGMDLHAGTPIVFVTGGEMMNIDLGGPELVTKPFAPGELVLRAMVAVLKSQVNPI